MKLRVLFLTFALAAFWTIGCGGGSMEHRAKRSGCENSCEQAKTKAVDECKESGKDETACTEAGNVAANKCIDECMSH